ncbi:adenylate/guanylate cyclase domain-containing protein [Candidatus Uhrbacteria bacterium]|nr:adenylate/guanylate cyclase domain-containing protein [Candidatus Uhrbacteria bacterium]
MPAKKTQSSTAIKKNVNISKTHFLNLPSCNLLDELLIQRIEHPEKTKQIDVAIRKQFERTTAIFILDMSGFSKLVQKFGIIHYLAMILRMRRVVNPAIKAFRGMVIKFEADNCFAVFQNTDDALHASLQIQHDLEVANLATPDESDVHVSIGIGYGPTLLACDDMYGNELNLASKLGEDVAERGEILITSAAKKSLKKKFSFESFPLTISGVTMKAYRLKK